MLKFIYSIVLLTLLGLASCGDDDKIVTVEKVDLLRFDFPQGNDPWDREIEQIAKDWGMYIIYKGVDSTHLNRRWTIPQYNEPIYVCSTPSSEDIQVYLNLVKEWLLGNLDKNKASDRSQLPVYLYLVNNLLDGNPHSPTYKRGHISLKKDGMDFWCLSFMSEELAAGLTPEMIHNIACSFSYPGLKARFLSGEYKIADDFAYMSDYDSPIGIRYYSLEDWLQDNPWFQKDDYEYMVAPWERDAYNVYQKRGFVPQLRDDFRIDDFNDFFGPTYGAPLWMPLIEYDYEYSPLILPSPEERPLLDFLNLIRTAMRYPETQIRETYPTDVEDPMEQYGNQLINDKYDLVVKYMQTTYGINLQKYAEILTR